MKKAIAIACSLACLVTFGAVDHRAWAAQTTANTIDFAKFIKLSKKVAKVRPKRLLSLDEFLARASEPDVLILDSRSAEAYAQSHLAGAVNLSVSDMTAESLREALGSSTRTILIYCNNNFADNEEPFVTKAPAAALNIPTFVTLWAYGYKNVYELGELLELSDPRLAFEEVGDDSLPESAAAISSR